MASVKKLLRQSAFQDFQASGTRWTGLDKWCVDNADKYETPARELRNAIAMEFDDELRRAKLAQYTDAQKIAPLIGATVPLALSKLVDMLEAKRTKFFAKDGVVVDERETTDNEAQISAAREILKVLGAYAPEKYEVLAGPLEEFTKLTEAELEKQLAELKGTTGEGTGDPPGTAGAQSGTRRLLVADSSHPDEGRTGPPKPIQALSSAGVLPLHPGRA